MSIKYTNSYQISVSLEPWFKKGYNFTSLKISESIGGQLPSGKLSMKIPPSDKAYKDVLSETTGTLHIANENEYGNVKTFNYDIPIFINYRNYEPMGELDIGFVCVGSGNFLTKRKMSKFTDIDKAIKSLYPGKVEIRGINSDVRSKSFLQNYETDYEALTRFCSGYKYGSVFGYSWSGLVIKNMIGIGSTGKNEKTEPFIVYGDNDSIIQNTPFQKTYDHDIFELPTSIWEDSDENGGSEFYRKHLPVNCRVIQKAGEQTIVGVDNVDLVKNSMYNNKYLSSDFFSRMTLTQQDIPQYRLGDLIGYRRSREIESSSLKDPNKYFINSGNVLFMAVDGDSQKVDDHGFKFSYTSEFLGILDDGVNKLGSDKDSVQDKEDNKS